MAAGWTAGDLLIIAVVVVCAASDLRTGRVYNVVTYPAIALGFGLALSGHGVSLPSAALGFLAGGLPLYLFFAAGWMGGGDVKLMAAVGAVKGFPFIVNAMFYSIFLAGVCAALVLLWKGEARATWQDAFSLTGRAGTAGRASIQPRGGSFPFAVAICIGTMVALALESNL